ncbi:MAG: EAL domain-containing protein [Burkholderiales bacterium]
MRTALINEVMAVQPSSVADTDVPLRCADGRWRADTPRHVLDSHYQPILSLSHRRTVGHEALLRATDRQGLPVSPMALFDAGTAPDQLHLDRLATALHLRNYLDSRPLSPHPLWLFLNLRPATFVHCLTQTPEHIQLLLPDLRGDGQVVVEFTEEVVARDADVEACAAQARRLGLLLALDDFGAGHSNFDRVWRLQPEIVKLDRSLVQRGALDSKAARVIAQMVSLLHECGSLVLMEGIETADEAHLALDCDADLVQGYLFGRPAPIGQVDPTLAARVAAVWHDFDQRSGSTQLADRARIAPHADAIAQAAAGLARHESLRDTCAAFLALPGAQLCYLLDQHGVQAGASLIAAGFDSAGLQRFAPMRDTEQACWARRPYFRRALDAPGIVQLTRPYLSIQGARLCVTVSIALQCAGQPIVLCGDVAWE